MVSKPSTPESRKVVRDVQAALKRTAEQLGAERFELDETEELTLDRLVSTIDRRVAVQAILDAELSAPERNSNTVVRLSAELRLLDKLSVDLRERINTEGEGPVKSARHQRAVMHRWNRVRAEREA